uniref:hypothetical protein n=1 Tax=Sphingomonas adhaesiva TaxID=28212 RepID=UPI0035C67FD5
MNTDTGSIPRFCVVALAAGLLLGAGETELALRAGLLLAINVVSVNLAALLVFFYKGIRPRT